MPGGYQAPVPGRPPGSRDGVGGDVPPLPEGRALRWRVAPRPSQGSQPDMRRGTHARWALDTVTHRTSSRYNVCNSCRQGRGSCTTVSCNGTYRRHDVTTPSVRIGSGASTRQSPGALPHASASRGLADPGPEVAPSSARSGPQVATAPALRCDAVSVCPGIGEPGPTEAPLFSTSCTDPGVQRGFPRSRGARPAFRARPGGLGPPRRPRGHAQRRRPLPGGAPASQPRAAAPRAAPDTSLLRGARSRSSSLQTYN